MTTRPCRNCELRYRKIEDSKAIDCHDYCCKNARLKEKKRLERENREIFNNKYWKNGR